nr:ATP-binding cassette domain-containing protein [uncultured Desulfobulbus sp.]
MDTDEPVLRLTNIHKSYGSDEVLKGINLIANRGEVLTLLGRSGAGKST